MVFDMSATCNTVMNGNCLQLGLGDGDWREEVQPQKDLRELELSWEDVTETSKERRRQRGPTHRDLWSRDG